MRRLALIALTGALLATPAAAWSDNWWFRTPGEAAYCGIPKSATWLCMRPEDGFWIRLIGIYGDNTDVRKGYEDRFRGYRDPAVEVLKFGRVQYTSDAAAITCWSRRTGLTCKQIGGLSFTLGRGGGYRIFYTAPGLPPNVRPLFRTDHGIYCGIDQDTLVPEYPTLDCWNPADGLVIGIGYPGARGRAGHHGLTIGFRPNGFPKLAHGRTSVWRCRKVTDFDAVNCSQRVGQPVFTCTSTRAQLTCRNRDGHGFWVSARSFYTF